MVYAFLSRLLVTVVENEAKVDPAVPNNADRTTKLRSQQEVCFLSNYVSPVFTDVIVVFLVYQRQGMAYILCRQATSLLQRTKLHVTVQCEAWHAKNARHMLLGMSSLIIDLHRSWPLRGFCE